jgi:hypothetical protein
LLQVAGTADVARQRAALRDRHPERDAAAWMLRPVGIASSTSRVMTVRVVMFCTSTTGDSAETGSFGNRADFQIAVDRRGEVRRQLDVLTTVKPGSVNDGVYRAAAGRSILTVAVGDGRSTFSISAGLATSDGDASSTAPDVF